MITRNFKKIIVVAIVLIIASLVVRQLFFKKEEPPFSFTEVKIGSIVQEVSAIGRVNKGEEINLSFKESGKIDEIYVEKGIEVKEGQNLVKLEMQQLSIQLSEARAALNLAQAELDKLLAGASQEEIEVAQTKVDNAQISYNNAKQNLEDVRREADENLDNAYEDTVNNLEEAYLKAYNAYNTVDSVERDNFGSGDQESFLVKQEKNDISNSVDEIELALESIEANDSQGNIDSSLSLVKDYLDDIYNSLSLIRSTCEDPDYRDKVSSADKTSLDNEKSYINTAISNVISDQQTISSTKVSNDSSINTAKASLSLSKGELEAAQNNLDLVLADPRPEDIVLYTAKVDQAEANVNLLLSKIGDAVLKSPVAGQVTKIEKELGEQVSITETVVSIIPSQPFQVEVDIAESDIGKINVGNEVLITLDAFPEEDFSGKVLEIDPAETIISGVVYYKTIISLETEDSKIKPGMTASVVIRTGFRENVLIVPQRALVERDSGRVVRVLRDDDNYDEVEVEVGLKGIGGEVEVVSGLKEGDRVITFIKNSE